MRQGLSNGSHGSGTQKGMPKFSCFLKTWQPETCPHRPKNSSSASPVRCSLGGCDHPPGTWVHPEEPPLEDAMPPTGHEETGPVKGRGEVSRGLEAGRGLAGGSELLGGSGPGGDMQERGISQLFPK